MEILQLSVLKENIIPFVPKPMGLLGQMLGDRGLKKRKK